MMVVVMCVGLLFPAGQAMAQKTGKVEKLISYLAENETDKFQKNREKLDEESLKGFPVEVALVDVLNDLWNGRKPEAGVRYFDCYQQAMQKAFPAMCTREKVDVEKLRTRSNDAVLALLAASTDKLAYSKQLIDAVVKDAYPMPQNQLAILYSTREEALLAAIAEGMTEAQCEVYLAEFPQGKFLHQVMSHYNDGLYQRLKGKPNAELFKLYFDNASVGKFFGQPERRKYIAEVRAMYDDFLYSHILLAKQPSEMRQRIDEYHASSYLAPKNRKWKDPLEYKTDSVDYILLEQQVKSAGQLKLIKDYLQTHRYKEFRDKALALRARFEEQVVWTTPTFMQAYSRGLLQKSNEVGTATRNSSITYTYNDKGILESNVTTISEKNQETVGNTSYFYNASGQPVLEVQTDQRTKKETYKRTRQYAGDGQILSDSLMYADGRLILRQYDKQGRMTGETEYAKGKMVYSLAHTYNNAGQNVESQYTYAMPDTPQPMYVISQTEQCEYDRYGYLVRKFCEKVTANNDKFNGVLTYLYDEFGNSIDSNAFYVYDHTGRWVRKIHAADPTQVEYVQCIYK